MTDKDNILLENFFKEAAQQQIEDNGFTERVMNNLPSSESIARRLSRLWTWFCIAVSLVLFFPLDGWDAMKSGMVMLCASGLTQLEVYLTTIPTVDLSLNPLVIFLILAFVLVFLPYQTYRKLSATL